MILAFFPQHNVCEIDPYHCLELLFIYLTAVQFSII